MMPQLISLHSAEASLVLELRDSAPPLWRHLGARADPAGLPPLADTRTAASFSLDRDVPLGTLPVGGSGWFGPEAVRVSRGQQPIAVRINRATAEQGPSHLAVTMHDDQAGLAFVQRYEVLPDGAFVMGAAVQNCGTTPILIDWLASAVLPVRMVTGEVISWRGRHNAELAERREALPEHAWVREGRRGIPGHGGPPGVLISDGAACNHTGLVYALQLCWSGDSRIAIERDDEGYWLLSAGAALQPGEVLLQPGETHRAPDAIVAVSRRGRNGAMAQQHAAVRARLRWPGGAMRPRPVHLNSWEACYFAHDAERIGQLAAAAAEIGVERFVLDDGWFKGRHDDTAGLGDWTPDPGKYPAGLQPLAEVVTSLGMEFGLWVEPEMVNPDSDLFRAHPDWALRGGGAGLITARNQLVLDLRREDVRDYLFGALDRLLRTLPIAYLKWDHNRDLAPPAGAGQVSGLYDLIARLRGAHPQVEIESCAGGGGRSDAGMAAHVHRFWTSDNIDAVSRVPMQRGFLTFLPPETMGAHVGASPAHATGRVQSLAFRAAIALPGHFGVELDPAQLADSDRAELADWISFYKQWRGVLHGGTVHMGRGADGLIWQAHECGGQFLLFVIRCAPPQDRRPQPLRLPFLAARPAWDVGLLRTATGTHAHAMHSAGLFDAMRTVPHRFSGSWLAQAGLPLPPLPAESVAIFHGRVAA